jgi:hypothetical protein
MLRFCGLISNNHLFNSKIVLIIPSVPLKVFKGKVKPKVKPNHHILVSDNEALKEKLEGKLQKSVERMSLEKGKVVISQTISEVQNVQVILDTNYTGFKNAIGFLEENKNNSLTFKLLPIDSNFIIGSNSSNDRGEVINL